MSGSEFDPDGVIDAVAPFVDLPIAPEHRAGVARHLRAAHAIAQPMLALDLPDEAEPGPVFAP